MLNCVILRQGGKSQGKWFIQLWSHMHFSKEATLKGVKSVGARGRHVVRVRPAPRSAAGRQPASGRHYADPGRGGAAGSCGALLCLSQGSLWRRVFPSYALICVHFPSLLEAVRGASCGSSMAMLIEFVV